MGRQRELRSLDELLGLALAGRPRIVVLRGEAGIGKSHLLRAVCERARGVGFAVGVGHGQQQLRLPYLALADACSGLARSAGARDPTAAQPWSALRALAEAAPEVAGRREPVGEGAAIERLLGMCESILELTRNVPTLMVVDDLHWADDESTALLLQLCFALADVEPGRPARVVIALATRPPDDESAQDRTLKRIARETVCTTIQLQGLDLLDTTELLATGSGQRPSPSIVQTVHEATRGNPLFIKALLAQARGDQIDPAKALEAGVRALPNELSEIVATQVRRSEPATQRLLRRAAVIGLRFPLRLLARVAGQALEDLLDGLSSVPQLCRLDGDFGELMHPLIHQELLLGMPNALRSQLHAEVLAQLALEPDADPAALAHHAQRGGEHVDAQRRLQLFLTAAQSLRASYAWGEAGRFFGAAAELTDAPAQRARLHYDAALCFQRYYDRAPALAHFGLALDGFKAVDDRGAVARVLVDRARIALYDVALGQLRDLSDLHAIGSQLPESEASTRGWVECALADAYFYANRPAEGAVHAQRALQLAEAEQDHRLARYACVPLGLSQAQAMDYAGAEQAFTDALDHASALGEPHLELAPRARRAGVRLVLGRIADAEADLRSSLHVADRSDPFEHALCLAHLCSLEVARGELANAEQSGVELLRRLPRLDGRPWTPLIGLPALAAARFHAGRVDAARRTLRALRTQGRYVHRVGGAEHVTAMVLEDWIAADQGAPKDDDAAEGRRARVERYAQRANVRAADGMALAAVAALAESCVHYQLPWALEGPRHVLEGALARGAVLTSAWPFSIGRVLAKIEGAFGDARRARELFERELERLDIIGARLEAARARVDYAHFLVALGDAADEQRARAVLASALDATVELGITPLLAEAQGLASAIGLRPPPAREPAAIERHELAFIHELMTAEAAPDLGERLLMSHEELRQRANSVLARLGVRGMLEATPYLFERGLARIDCPPSGLPLVLLVTDLAGFTPMVERLGDVEAQRVMHAHNALLRKEIRDHGGLEITHTGDGIVAAFRSSPEAIACAVALQRAFDVQSNASSSLRLRIRIGVHAGEPLLEEGRLFGVALIAAVRICSVCDPDRILVSDVVRRSTREAAFRFAETGTRNLKGLREPMMLHEVLWRSPELSQLAGLAEGTPPLEENIR